MHLSPAPALWNTKYFWSNGAQAIWPCGLDVQCRVSPWAGSCMQGQRASSVCGCDLECWLNPIQFWIWLCSNLARRSSCGMAPCGSAIMYPVGFTMDLKIQQQASRGSVNCCGTGSHGNKCCLRSPAASGGVLPLLP